MRFMKGKQLSSIESDSLLNAILVVFVITGL
jgi:hypothetical protein